MPWGPDACLSQMVAPYIWSRMVTVSKHWTAQWGDHQLQSLPWFEFQFLPDNFELTAPKRKKTWWSIQSNNVRPIQLKKRCTAKSEAKLAWRISHWSWTHWVILLSSKCVYFDQRQGNWWFVELLELVISGNSGISVQNLLQWRYMFHNLHITLRIRFTLEHFRLRHYIHTVFAILTVCQPTLLKYIM